MRQVTLVAFYGQKPEPVASLISECQNEIARRFPDFTSYDVRQVHATIIGLERVPCGLYNKNLWENREKQMTMDVHGFRDFLRRTGHIPFAVQIGGFQDRDYSFRSRGQRPYTRSFSIQRDKAVVMGWPLRGEPVPDVIDTSTLIQEVRKYLNTLDDVRRAAQAFNILHLYHGHKTDVDNDFYFRVGTFASAPAQDDPVLLQTQEELRRFLQHREPLIVEIGISDLYFVGYEEGDEALPLDTSVPMPLEESDPLTLLD